VQRAGILGPEENIVRRTSLRVGNVRGTATAIARRSTDMSARTRPGTFIAVLVCASALIASALILGGCVDIVAFQVNSGVAAGSQHLITLDASATVPSESPVRAVIALRIPSAWDVKSVTLAGPTVTDTFQESSVIAGVYAGEWEAEPVGIGHNGHKDGYKWWAGYTAGAHVWTLGQSGRVAIIIDTHGRGGSYLLDLVTGVAGSDDPEDLADKSLWQIGGGGLRPSGVRLDEAITLYCFADVAPQTQYFEAIQGMGAKGLIEGYPSGSEGYRDFRPGNPVLRAQFAKMIVGALGLGVDEAMAPPVNLRDLGTDVPTNLYPHEYVWMAYANNITKGYSDGTFRPYVGISRGHAVTMTVRALQRLYPGVLQPVPSTYVQTWGKDLLPEHSANARIAHHNGLLAGLPLTTAAADGNAPMSRGEVAQLLWNMMGLITP
jgi:hypothetical protein